MSDLILYKSERFGDYVCDFYKNENNEIFMTSQQLGLVLGYGNPRKAISTLVSRNEYICDKEFSDTLKLRTPSGTQETRVFTEDGIYEVTFLSKTEVAKEFRKWIRKILKGLRKGEIELILKQQEEDKPKIEFYNQCMLAENHYTMLQASKILKISGRNKLFKFLRDEMILMNKGERHNIPYQTYIDQKYFTVIISTLLIGKTVVNIPVTLVSAKGLEFIRKRLYKKRKTASSS